MRYILLSPSITSVWESSTFPINFWNQDLCAPTSPSTSETVWQNHMQNPRDYGPRGITPRDAQKHPKPQTYRMLLKPWPSMTIHDHPMMRMEKDSPRSATKQKRRTVQHLRKISCRCTSPRPRACRAWIQIANPKIHGETSDIDCDSSHVHSSQLLFLSSIFPIGFFQI